MGVSVAFDLNKKTLWLTHTKDLLTQSYERAAQYIDKRLLGTITGGKVNIGEGITFATVQTMSKLDLSLYKYTWDVIIIDECHRLAGTPLSVTMFSKVINNLAAPYKYGLSATVHRGDGLIKSTFALIGNVIAVVSESEVEDKTIGVTVQRINTDTKITDECLETDGTINYPALINYLVENKQRSKVIAEILKDNVKHSNLVMSDRLQHLRNIIDCLIELGISESKIRMIDGSMVSKKGKDQRQQAIEDLKNGTANYLFATYNLAKEGLDIPVLDRLYLTIPKKDFAIVTQSIGRISRVAHCKDSAICYDFVDQIGFCEGSWKKRKTIYKKKGCEIKEENVKVVKKSTDLFDFACNAEVLT
jgi:superfamily II DNA or RNA helicase